MNKITVDLTIVYLQNTMSMITVHLAMVYLQQQINNHLNSTDYLKTHFSVDCSSRMFLCLWHGASEGILISGCLSVCLSAG